MLKDGNGDHTVCYAATYPVSGPTSDSKKHAVFVVAERRGNRPEVAIEDVGGASSAMDVRIGPKYLKFAVDDGTAFAPKHEHIIDDLEKFVRAYVPVRHERHGSGITVFSLMGFTKTYYLTRDLCTIAWTGRPLPPRSPILGKANRDVG